MRKTPGYAVGLVRTLNNLEEGLVMLEIVYNDERRLIAGFVFVSSTGACDYRGPDGNKVERDRLNAVRKGFKQAVENYLEKGTP